MNLNEFLNENISERNQKQIILEDAESDIYDAPGKPVTVNPAESKLFEFKNPWKSVIEDPNAQTTDPYKTAVVRGTALANSGSQPMIDGEKANDFSLSNMKSPNELRDDIINKYFDDKKSLANSDTLENQKQNNLITTQQKAYTEKSLANSDELERYRTKVQNNQTNELNPWAVGIPAALAAGAGALALRRKLKKKQS